MQKKLTIVTIAFTLAIALGAGSSTATAAPITVFSTNFDGALPTELTPGTATLTGVQGYAGLGPTGNQFGGNFLRSATGNVVTLNLTNLPVHDTISLAFLLDRRDRLARRHRHVSRWGFLQNRVRRYDAFQ